MCLRGDGPRIPIIAGRLRPHELLLFAVSVVTGSAYVFGATPPASMAATLPGWAVHIWAAALAVSGMAGLAGGLTRYWWSLQVEQAALLIGAAALVWYTVSVAHLGGRALFAGAVVAGWAVANLGRAWQIHRDLTRR